jgi:uncharacterized protein (TIGR03083 family)
MPMTPWTEIEADRTSFADYLETLTPADWDTPSLCEGWTVKGVATHLLVTPTMSKGKVFLEFAGSGFNLSKMSQKQIDRMTSSMSTEEIVIRTRETAGVQTAPPGLKPMGVLSEVLTHTSDISLALDTPLDLPVDHYVLGLDYMKDVQPVLGCKKRIAGLTLRATDADWTYGDGPIVEGDAKHLLSAMTGRTAALDSLTGDGVDVLRSRD